MTTPPEPHELAPASEVAQAAATGGAKPSNAVVEYGPILVFVLLYFFLRREDPDGALYSAAAVFAVVAVLALVWARMKLGRWPGMLLATTAIIGVSVGAAFLFDNKAFIYMKPTVVYLATALVLVGGMLAGKLFIKLLMGEAFSMTDQAWRTLTWRYSAFCVFAAGLNEYVWRTQTEGVWVQFKLWAIGIAVLFMMTQMPFIMRNARGVDGEGGDSPE